MFTTSQTLDKVYYKEIKVWHYSLAEFDRAAELLESVDWDSLLPQDDVNTYWSAWINYFMQIMEICIPHSVVKVKRNLPWVNKCSQSDQEEKYSISHC